MKEAPLTAKADRDLKRYFENTDEAHELLALIVAEFESDPMSVQCFDLGVVERAKQCVRERKELGKQGMFI